MGITAVVEYMLNEISFRYHSARYSLLKESSPEKAEKHLRKAVIAGRDFISLGGYVPDAQRSRLRHLEEQLANQNS
jgi:hypothetical protein